MKTKGILITLLLSCMLIASTGDSTNKIPVGKDSQPTDIVSIRVSEYPPPLNVNGLHKYQVVINSTLVDMPTETADKILKIYNIDAIPKDKFHEMDNGRYGIWAGTGKSLTNQPKSDDIKDVF
jgi:hypothetical protein